MVTAAVLVDLRQEHLLLFPVASTGAAELSGGEEMPVLILWAVPAILVVGGGIYLIGHMH